MYYIKRLGKSQTKINAPGWKTIWVHKIVCFNELMRPQGAEGCCVRCRFFSLGVNKFDVVWRSARWGWGCERLLIYAACVGGSIALGVQQRSEINEPLRSKKWKRKNKVWAALHSLQVTCCAPAALIYAACGDKRDPGSSDALFLPFLFRPLIATLVPHCFSRQQRGAFWKHRLPQHLIELTLLKCC